MTNLEAADLLDNLIGMVSDNHDSDYDEALRMGRDLLEQEPIIDKIRAEIENMEIVYDKSVNYKDERTDEEKANDWGKMYKVLVLSIIDKYKAESEE